MKEINTQRLILRKIKEKDNKEIFKILSDKSVIENLNMDIHITIQDTEKLIEDYLKEYKKGNKFPYAIIDKKTSEFIGVFLIKIDLYDEDCFEFTIYLKKEFWGKGIYSEVLPYMVKVAFEDVKTENFRGFVMEKNIASSKVLERNNFILEKIFEVPNIEGKIKSYLITKKEYYESKSKNEPTHYDRAKEIYN